MNSFNKHCHTVRLFVNFYRNLFLTFRTRVRRLSFGMSLLENLPGHFLVILSYWKLTEMLNFLKHVEQLYMLNWKGVKGLTAGSKEKKYGSKVRFYSFIWIVFKFKGICVTIRALFTPSFRTYETKHSLFWHPRARYNTSFHCKTME